jgi:hypothetical protein
MKTATTLNGTCLCGAVKISIDSTPATFDVCHCSMCRRWGGGPAMTVESGKGYKITGESNIAVYASSDWAERGFCKTCGTHLFYRFRNGGYCNFTLGLFPGTEHFTFKTEIYVDDQPANYAFANKTERMTEAEVIAKFSPST